MQNRIEINPSNLRRVSAGVYDFIVLVAIWIVFLLPVQALANETILPQWLTLSIIVLITEIFFSYFWFYGGQTIGMRAWKIQLVQNDNSPLTFFQASLRLPLNIVTLAPLLVPLFLGIDKKNKTISDRWLKTRIRFQEY